MSKQVKVEAIKIMKHTKKQLIRSGGSLFIPILIYIMGATGHMAVTIEIFLIIGSYALIGVLLPVSDKEYLNYLKKNSPK